MKKILTTILTIVVANVYAQTIFTIAGNGGKDGYDGNGKLATSALLSSPTGIAVTSNGDIVFCDNNNKGFYCRIRKIDANTGRVTTIAGNGEKGGVVEGIALNTPLLYNDVIAVDKNDNIYIAQSYAIYKLDAAGNITRVAGNGNDGYTEDGKKVINSPVGNCGAMVIDKNNNLYGSFSYRKDTAQKDGYNFTIRKIDLNTGIINTIAGKGTYGSDGNGGQAVNATVGAAKGMCIDRKGNIYFTQDYQVRMINIATGIITKIAGQDKGGYMGSDGPAINAELKMPMGLAVDDNENLYIADNMNARVQRINLKTGIMYDFSGLGWRLGMWSPGYSGDRGSALLARMASPRGIAIDANGYVYVTEPLNHTVRVIRPDNYDKEVIVTLGLMYLLFGTETGKSSSGNCQCCNGAGEVVKPVFDIADGVSRDKVLKCLCCNNR